MLLCALLLAATPEIVASVRLDAPASEQARLARYLELEIGQPLQPEALRHAVELLFASGEYEDVVVETEPGPNGLVVVFHPRKAPLFRRLERAGDPLLTLSQLAKLVRLRPREPLFPARLARAGKAVTQQLIADGYLDAEVGVSARRTPEGADAVFEIHGGRRVRVAAARVIAPAGAFHGLLQPLLRPRPGAVFRRQQAQDAADAMRRRLVQLGYWQSTVGLDESLDPATSLIGLEFRVAPGGITRVAFAGAEVPGSLRREVQGLLRDGAAKPDALEEGIDRLESYLRRSGYRDAAASYRSQDQQGAQQITYTLKPGPRTQVMSVRVEGEQVEGLEELLKTRALAPLQDRVLADDVRALVRALEERGHVSAVVEPIVPEGGGGVPVVFRVRAGPRTRVASVALDPPNVPAGEGEPRELRLRAGQPYRVADLARDRGEIIAAYRNAGYPQVEITPQVDFSEDRSEASIVLRAQPGPRIDVDHVVVAGLAATREVVVRRELTLRDGQPLGLQKVLESQRKLLGLGLFSRVSLTEMDPESISRRSVVVALDEGPRTTVAYGLGYAERDLLRGSVEVARRNLFGMDRTLSAFTRMSFRGSRLLISLREPYLFGHKQELFTTAFREEEDREFFDFIRYGGVVQTARALSTRWSLILRYTYQQTDSFNIVDPDQVDREFSASTLSGPSVSVVYDTRDDPLDPRRGRFVTGDVVLSHVALGGDSFARGFFQAASYRRLRPGLVLALSTRFGLARTFGFDEPLLLPRPDRFYSGGDYGLRGFPVDAVLPRGGNALLLAGSELRYDLPHSLGVAGFFEAGNVYPLASNLDLANLRTVAGLGLRYKSAFGPLRVDWGYKLDRREGEGAYRFHFTVGHAF